MSHLFTSKFVLLFKATKHFKFERSSCRISNYRPPTKLLESYVFSRVCLSVCPLNGGPCTRSQPWPLYRVQHQSPSPDMFKLVQLGPHWTGTIPCLFNFFRYEAWTVNMRAVVFLLKCLLVATQFRSATWPGIQGA